MSQNTSNNQPKKNPLAGYFRQPKLYVQLPSHGKFYPPGSLDVSTTGEYPVYAMTAKDELMMKTPDALLTGQSTVEVLKSCVPSILDPWQLPSIDLDFLLICIRIATYGDKMEITSTCPSCSHKNDFEIDLNVWLKMFAQYQFVDVIDIDPLTVHIKPYSYREITKTSIKTLEQQKIFAIVNDETMSDSDKLDEFGKSFVKLTELTVDIIANSITKIVTPEGECTDKAMILEFINNASKDIFEKIQAHIMNLKDQITLDIKGAHCQECQHQFDIPVTMDQANFFAVRS